MYGGEEAGRRVAATGGCDASAEWRFMWCPALSLKVRSGHCGGVGGRFVFFRCVRPEGFVRVGAWSVVARRQGEADAEVQLKVQGVCLVEVLNSTSVVEMIAYAGFGKDAPLAAEVELDAGRGVKRPLW